MLNPMKFTTQQALKVTFTFFAVLVASAFFIEHILQVAPCKMCWWQRYTHWLILLFVAFCLVIREEAVKRRGLMVTLIMALVSLAIGAYQSMGQLGLMELPLSCSGGAAASFDNLADPADLMGELENLTNLEPSCTDTSFTIFGVTLAGWNVIVMSAVSIVIGKWMHSNRQK